MNHPKIAQKLLKFCQSGEILPYLVTLDPGEYYRTSKSKNSFGFIDKVGNVSKAAAFVKRTFLQHKTAVISCWQCDQMFEKVSLLFPKSCPKIGTAVLGRSKVMVLKIPLKVSKKIVCYFCTKTCHPRSLKIRPIWSHWLLTLSVPVKWAKSHCSCLRLTECPCRPAAGLK